MKAPAMEFAARALAEERVAEGAVTLTGRMIAHYEVLDKLGEGGMGVVYRARDERLKRDVAIKVLPPELMRDPERKKRFIQEERAASALSHSNIVTIYDIVSEDGCNFIVMEYVAGKTLSQKIGRKGMKLGDVLKHAIQSADALAAAHNAGIIHRDLKPANIVVTEDGRVKVLDFGLAKLTQPEPESESRIESSMALRLGRAGSWGRRPTCRRSRPKARPWMHGRTSSRSDACCTRWRLDIGPSWGTAVWRPYLPYCIGSLPRWESVPIDLDIVEEAYSLAEPFHADPVDRLLVATARMHGLHLITADEKILAYPHVRTLW